MSTPAPKKDTATATPGEILRDTLRRLFYLGRDIKNNAQHALSAAEDWNSANDERRDYARRSFPQHADAALRDVQAAHAAAAPLVAALEGETPEGLKDHGCSILVKFCPPSGTQGARWAASLWRDSSLTFRARADFTFDDKDKDGADVAAARCLSKFQDYCNTPVEGIESREHARRAFRLSGRASLGNGSYVYTFTRN